jgi:hypothetical protein
MTRSTDIQHDIRLVDYRVAIRDCRADLYLRFVGKAGFNTGPHVRYSCGQLLDVGKNQRNAPSQACRSRSKPTRLILAQMSWSRVTPWAWRWPARQPSIRRVRQNRCQKSAFIRACGASPQIGECAEV